MECDFASVTRPAWKRLQGDLVRFWRAIRSDSKTQDGARPRDVAPHFVQYFLESVDLVVRKTELSDVPRSVGDQLQAQLVKMERPVA